MTENLRPQRPPGQSAQGQIPEPACASGREALAWADATPSDVCAQPLLLPELAGQEKSLAGVCPVEKGPGTAGGTFWKADLWHASLTLCPCPGPTALSDPAPQPLLVSSSIHQAHSEGSRGLCRDWLSRATRSAQQGLRHGCPVTLLPVPPMGPE